MKIRIQGFCIDSGTLAKALLVLSLCVNAGCGGGGGGAAGTGNPGPDGPGPSKLFIAVSVNSVIVSSANANPSPGTLTINRTIAGPATSSLMPDLAYDSVNDRLYVANNSAITVINNASVATGATIPARTISISGITSLGAMSLDTVNDVLYVADFNFLSPQILVFDSISTANGLTAPSRSIQLIRNATVGPPTAVPPNDVYIDPAHNVLYVSGSVGSGGLVNRVILVYDHASTITGAVTADRELTFANNIVGIIGDSANDRLFVEDATASTVMVFDGASAVASGTGTPTRTINLPDVVQKITLGNGGDRLYGLSTATAGVFIVNNADIVSGPVPLTFVASPGGIFPTAIAVAP